MAAHRCSDCNLDWPTMVVYLAPPKKDGSGAGSVERPVDFTHCPECGALTWVCQKCVAMEKDEAKARVKEARFTHYYREHEARREGPSPDVLGRRQARELLELKAKTEAELAALPMTAEGPS